MALSVNVAAGGARVLLVACHVHKRSRICTRFYSLASSWERCQSSSLSCDKTAMPRKQRDLPANYAAMLAELKGRIVAARLKAALAVNSELILLYWQIGHDILRQQRDEGWGAK